MLKFTFYLKAPASEQDTPRPSSQHKDVLDSIQRNPKQVVFNTSEEMDLKFK